MVDRRPLATEEDRELFVPTYSTRLTPKPPPTVEAFAEPLFGCCINGEWMSHILGALATLEWPDMWEGTDEEKQFALDQIVRIQDAMTCRCGTGTRIIQKTVNENYRFQLGLEFNLNGLDGVAPDRPDTFFDEDTADIGDDIIRRENALCMACIDYVHTVLDDAARTAEDVGVTVGTTLFQPAFALGPMAGAAFVAGVAFLTLGAIAFINDPVSRFEIACCMLDGLKGKAITNVNFESSLSNCGFTVPSDVDTIREIVESSLNDQGNFISFVKSVGAYFSFADVQPISCPCIDLGLFCDFTIDECAFDAVLGPNGPEAAYVAETGWNNGPSGVINHFIKIDSQFSEDISFTAVRIFIEHTNTANIQWQVRLFDDVDTELLNQSITLPAAHTNHKFEFTEETGVRRIELKVLKTGLETEFNGHITAVQVEADPPPFPTQVP